MFILDISPDEWNTLKNQTDINLSKRGLTRIPSTLSTFSSLRSLDLDGNPFGDNFPLAICSLSQLPTLEMGGCSLTSIPQEITQMTSLQKLSLSINRLSGCFPTHLLQLRQLENLSLSGNKELGGDIPSTISQLSRLKELSLSGCKFTSLPSTISQLSHLNSLWIINNQLTTLPLELAQCRNLEYFVCSSNPFLPPLNTLKSDGSEIRRYLRECLEGMTRWNQMKVILLGHGSAGKVSTH